MKAHARQRLAIVVSHPIQYYVPLYRRLARRADVEIKVFFTWHAGERAVLDPGFGRPIAWDIPLTDGYDWTLVPNTSADPGTHHFFGLRNPSLVHEVRAWRPDAVHLTGWAWHSHLIALRRWSQAGIPVLFRGDSHLLGRPRRGLRWLGKRAVLGRVFRWPARCLYAGSANREYYEAFGVPPERLAFCPHSIEVERFAADALAREHEAAAWRSQLQVPEDRVVVLFAGKFEPVKRPLELMEAMLAMDGTRFSLIMVGGGPLQERIEALATKDPRRFRLLPFQNQSRMPVVYRLGDVVALPSAAETWGLAVNEAMASGRPVVVSDRVGCAPEMVDADTGRVFPWNDFASMARALEAMAPDRKSALEMGRHALRKTREFDIGVTEEAVVEAVRRVRAR